ncbi:hypothetical protein TSUD_32010 [Trifolium subterraneum]|uniref:Reverse transcriptase domain-containing protein n=1 Tax=Trifolium subterraneum TaxID=3900 RepID=A0A2Z6M9V4_TRISU|nr:hypothetical protein TSUD_32010 [Trifolium subterraneum]
MDRNILDAASGRALVDKTPAAAKALIENMSLNSQQFTTRSNYVAQTIGVNEIQASSSNKALESRIDKLTSLVKQLALEKTQTERVCGPSLKNVVKQMAMQNIQFQQQMVAQNIQFQQTASASINASNASINDLKTQVRQLAIAMNQMQTQGSGNLPAQTLRNPNFSAITLRSGKEVAPLGLVIQLENMSITRPKGVVEDVLVKVNDLIFPADFYILDMQRETDSSKATIILGRPFMRTTRSKIDVYAGTLSMEFGKHVVNFNIFDSMKHPLEGHSVFQMELISEIVDEAHPNLFLNDFPSLSGFDDFYSCDDYIDTNLCVVCAEIDVALQGDISHTATSLELKSVPKNLKYAYLERNKKLPVIISSKLDYDQENKLLQDFKKHKKAIGRTLADIQGTNKVFKVNGQRMKLFHESLKPEEKIVEEAIIPYRNNTLAPRMCSFLFLTYAYFTLRTMSDSSVGGNILHFTHRWEHFTDTQHSTRQKAIFGCLKVAHAQEFLLVIPIDGLGQHMSQVEYRIILKYRLIIPIFPKDEICLVCRKVCLDIFREHAVHCRELSDFKYMHDLVRDVFFYIFRHVRISVKKEAPVNFLIGPQEAIDTSVGGCSSVWMGRWETCLCRFD